MKSGWTIKTTFYGPTNYKGPRIRASVLRDENTVWKSWIEYKSKLESKENHMRAANKLIQEWEFKEKFPNMKIVSYGFDTYHYYFIVA